MSNKSCPISFVLVDANIARINAFFVSLLFVLFLMSSNSAFLYFLILDFATRIYFKKEYSMIYILSHKSQELLALERLMVDSAPKRLAALFGLTFLLAIAVADFFGLTLFLYVLSTVLLACTALEVAFSYCLGCEIYHLYKRVFL